MASVSYTNMDCNCPYVTSMYLSLLVQELYWVWLKIVRSCKKRADQESQHNPPKTISMSHVYNIKSKLNIPDICVYLKLVQKFAWISLSCSADMNVSMPLPTTCNHFLSFFINIKLCKLNIWSILFCTLNLTYIVCTRYTLFC